jgi:hypothetical protein
MLFGGVFVVSAVLGTVSCQRGGGSSGSASPEMVATIRVVSGNGRLAGGEEYSIAEWRSGAQDTKDAGADFYADFRGQDGGPTLDLSLSGLNGLGEVACGGTQASNVSLELRVDVNNAYRAAPDAPCRIEVERVENGVMEGRYTATLRHTGNPSDEMTVAGTFRAAVGSSAPVIEAAHAPKVGLR